MGQEGTPPVARVSREQAGGVSTTVCGSFMSTELDDWKMLC